MKTLSQLETKATELNNRFPTLGASVVTSPWGNSASIKVATMDKAKALNEMFLGFNFTF
jgi:hypothetical protein